MKPITLQTFGACALALGAVACETADGEVAATDAPLSVEGATPVTTGCGKTTMCGKWSTMVVEVYGMRETFTTLSPIELRKEPAAAVVGTRDYQIQNPVKRGGIVLSRAAGGDQKFWDWRNAVLEGQDARSDGAISFLDLNGRAIGQIRFADAWPSAMGEKLSDKGLHFEMTLQYSEIELQLPPGSGFSIDKPFVELLENRSPLFGFGMFESIEGLESRTQVVNTTSGLALPGQPVTPTLKLRRLAGMYSTPVSNWLSNVYPTEKDLQILVRFGSSTAKPSAEWHVTGAQIVKQTVSLDPTTGKLMEEIELVALSLTRVQI